MGICQTLSLEVFPANKRSFVIYSSFVQIPAAELPRAVMTAPVKVES
jgi:hypothetical protein